MMNQYLYLDTSGSSCTVMLFTPDGILAKRHIETKANHGQALNVLIKEILDETGSGFKDLQGICVLNGPGSYTGLRISLSSAKGICYAMSIPLLLIHKLELMQFCAKSKEAGSAKACMLKARENEYFISIHDEKGDNLLEPALMQGEDVKALLDSTHAVAFCEQAEMLEEFQGTKQLIIEDQHIIGLCSDYLKQEKFADLFQSEPFYMKKVHINKINKL